MRELKECIDFLETHGFRLESVNSVSGMLYDDNGSIEATINIRGTESIDVVKAHEFCSKRSVKLTLITRSY